MKPRVYKAGRPSIPGRYRKASNQEMDEFLTDPEHYRRQK